MSTQRHNNNTDFLGYIDDIPSVRKRMLNGCRAFGRLMGAQVMTTGASILPEGRYLLVCNHRSIFDPILTGPIFQNEHLSFISKPENFKIPIAGYMMRRSYYIPIDRVNPRNALVTINKAADFLTEDRGSVAVYPEGTRSRDNTLLPFHDAVFKIAQKANVPIVVCTIQGTEKIHRNFPWKKTLIHLDLLACIPKEEVQAKRTSELGAEIRAIMEKNLAQEQQ